MYNRAGNKTKITHSEKPCDRLNEKTELHNDRKEMGLDALCIKFTESKNQTHINVSDTKATF